MSEAIAVINDCWEAGLSVTPKPDGNLYLHPVDALTDNLRQKLIANKPGVHAHLSAQRQMNIHRVLVQLKDIKPYRSGVALLWHGEPTLVQQVLLQEYEADLIEALTPRLLTSREAEALALWLHDIGATTKAERDATFRQANISPADRVALLWIAEGSPV